MAVGKTVLATGAFDLLHPGHLRFLEESKKVGGQKAKLVVVVARDSTVLHRKGKNPIIPEQQRLRLVAALKPVNKAMLGHREVSFLATLRKIKPDIVCIGHDQNDIKKAVQKVVDKEKLPIRVIQIAHYGPPGFNSSTRVKKRVLRALSSNN